MFVDPHTQSDDFFSTLKGEHDTLRDKLSYLSDSSVENLQRAKLKLIKEGVSFTDLSMINPDMEPPRALLDRLFEATHNPLNHRYAVARGVRKLRQAVADKYLKAFEVSIDPENQICMTFGSKDACLHLLQALWHKGAKVLVPAPTYPAHIAASVLSGYEVDTFLLSRDENETLSRIDQKLSENHYRAILLNFPHNPTGISVSADFYKKLESRIAASKKKCFLINDFVYGEMPLSINEKQLVAGNPPSLLAAGSSKYVSTLEIFSMSKAYNVPGWRIGAVCGAAQVVRLLSELKAYVDYGIFLPLQYAAASVLGSKEDHVAETRKNYQSRSDFLINGLRALGWEISKPDAGVSIWAKLPEKFESLGSGDFCTRLLLEERVLFMPGCLFGDDFNSFVRIALVRPEEDLALVLERVSRFMSSYTIKGA